MDAKYIIHIRKKENQYYGQVIVKIVGYSGDVDPLFRDIDPLSGKRFNEQSL
jgi:hypothetical protein